MDKIRSLTPEILSIVCDSKTQAPFSCNDFEPLKAGSYLCKRCGIALFRAHNKFNSGCGWPSFDESIAYNVEESIDPDGMRTEIHCKRCKAHLGHVFKGENFTHKNTRFCVNSLSIEFVADEKVKDTKEVIVAGGCFWGVEYYLNQLSGVLKTEVGFIGGHVLNPTYNEVCQTNTGHFEAVRIIYDPEQISYFDVLKKFFEIHDPTQQDGQGSDIGRQYQSAIFYYNQEQQNIACKIIEKLKDKGFKVATKILPVTPFWGAEDYHQQYYNKNKKLPYCHSPVPRFE